MLAVVEADAEYLPGGGAGEPSASGRTGVPSVNWPAAAQVVKAPQTS